MDGKWFFFFYHWSGKKACQTYQNTCIISSISCLWWRNCDLMWVFCWDMPNTLRDQKAWPMHSTSLHLPCQIHGLLGFPQRSHSNSMNSLLSSLWCTLLHQTSEDRGPKSFRCIPHRRTVAAVAGASNTWHTLRGCGSAMLPPRGPQGWVAITAIGLVREKWTWTLATPHHTTSYTITEIERLERFCPKESTQSIYECQCLWQCVRSSLVFYGVLNIGLGMSGYMILIH